MFNLNGAGPQTGGGDSVIPAGTFALVTVAVKQPKQGQASQQHPMITENPQTGSMYIELELTVTGTVDPQTGQLTPKYAKKKMWDKIGLRSGAEAQQRARANGKDPEAWAKVGYATFMALMQAAWGIQTAQLDQHADRFQNVTLEQLHGITVPIKVGVDDPKPNQANPNPRKSNRIGFVMLPETKEYGVMMAGQGGAAPAPQQGGGFGGGQAPANNGGGSAWGGQPQQPANNGGNAWGNNGNASAPTGGAWGKTA